MRKGFSLFLSFLALPPTPQLDSQHGLKLLLVERSLTEPVLLLRSHPPAKDLVLRERFESTAAFCTEGHCCDPPLNPTKDTLVGFMRLKSYAVVMSARKALVAVVPATKCQSLVYGPESLGCL